MTAEEKLARYERAFLPGYPVNGLAREAITHYRKLRDRMAACTGHYADCCFHKYQSNCNCGWTEMLREGREFLDGKGRE